VSANRSKGTAFEAAVVAWLQGHGYPNAERRALSGSKDRGDITGLGSTNWVLELKDCQAMSLAAWVDEAQVEKANAGAKYAAVIHKRRGKSVGGAYVTMTMEDFLASGRMAPRQWEYPVGDVAYPEQPLDGQTVTFEQVILALHGLWNPPDA
jgi:hypothetical protein